MRIRIHNKHIHTERHRERTETHRVYIQGKRNAKSPTSTRPKSSTKMPHKAIKRKGTRGRVGKKGGHRQRHGCARAKVLGGIE